MIVYTQLRCIHNVHIHVHVHVHVHIHTCTCACTRTYMCMYMYIHCTCLPEPNILCLFCTVQKSHARVMSTNVIRDNDREYRAFHCCPTFHVNWSRVETPSAHHAVQVHVFPELSFPPWPALTNVDSRV